MSDDRLASDFLVKNVERLRDALDHHNATCEGEAAAFVSPYDSGLLPFEALWGVPLVADTERAVKGFTVVCPRHQAKFDHPGLFGD